MKKSIKILLLVLIIAILALLIAFFLKKGNASDNTNPDLNDISETEDINNAVIQDDNNDEEETASKDVEGDTLQRQEEVQETSELVTEDPYEINEDAIRYIAYPLGMCMIEDYDNNHEYLPDNKAFVTSALFYFAGLNCYDFEDLVGYEEGFKLISRENIEAYAVTLFEGMTEVTIAELYSYDDSLLVRYDENRDYYVLHDGDPAPYLVKIESTEWNGDVLTAVVNIYCSDEGIMEEDTLDAVLELSLVLNENELAKSKGLKYSVRDCEFSYRKEYNTATPLSEEEINAIINGL